MPGLTFSQNAIFAQPVIRGIGSSSTGLGDEANVATYIDGVYMSRMLGNFYELDGVQSVEVLKGPQGTLFGRYATGGAISINTLAPSPTPAGNFSLSYGNYNDVVAKGYLTGSLAPDLAGNISAITSGGTVFTPTSPKTVRRPITSTPAHSGRSLLIHRILRSASPPNSTMTSRTTPRRVITSAERKQHRRIARRDGAERRL